jgi:hypothetical protein
MKEIFFQKYETDDPPAFNSSVYNVWSFNLRAPGRRNITNSLEQSPLRDANSPQLVTKFPDFCETQKLQSSRM